VETIPFKPATTKDYGQVAPASVWDQVLAVLVRTMEPHHFNTWLKPTRQIGNISDGVLRVAVPSLVFADWIGKSYLTAIAGALEGLGRRDLSIELVPLNTGPMPAPEPFVDASARIQQQRSWQTDRGFDYPTFRTSSGLIDKKHRHKIGPAIWEFLWCIDKQTGPHGLVLGGRPVTLAEIAGSFGVTRRHVSSALGRLGQHRYISVTQNQRGLIIRVLNQKKFGPRRRRL
jgi:DnaA-like protein